MLAALNFMTLILSRLIRQMLANFFEVDSKGLYQSTGEEKESCCLVFPSSTKREIRHFHVEVVKRRERNVQKAWCTCKVVVLLIKPIVFSLFSLPSPSLDLKLPNGSLFLSPKPVPGVRMVQKKREKQICKKTARSAPPPTLFFFSAHISLSCPHGLNTWNRLFLPRGRKGENRGNENEQYLTQLRR